jgi:hypothetical protein
MNDDDDRKDLMSVVVDLDSTESVKVEAARWKKTEIHFENLIPNHVDKLHSILLKGATSGAIDTHELNQVIFEMAHVYRDYGVAFATAKSLEMFGIWRESADEPETWTLP